MFIDYYKILKIGSNSNPTEIKKAWKNLAIKFHPDKNPDKDTTKKMQVINEAYMILRDVEARKRYDIEYQRYKNSEKGESNESTRKTSNEYVFSDKTLEDWISKAKNKSLDLAKKSLEDLIGMSAVGIKAASKEVSNHLLANIVISLISILILGLIGSGC